MAKKVELVFYEVGDVERASGGSYVWRPGFSRRQDGGEQPWRTVLECREEAYREGLRARFVWRR